MKGTVRKPRTAGGTWSFRIDAGLDDRGRRRQREVGGFRTKTEAQAALNDALSGSQHRTYVAPSRTTVRQFLDEWHAGARTELGVTAWTNYGQIIRRNIQPYLGAKRLTDLSPLDVKRWHGKLLESGRKDGGPLSVASLKLAHPILHSALADAVRWNLIAVNPATGVRAPRGEPTEMTVWTAEEAKRFLEAMAEDRVIALWASRSTPGSGAASSPVCGEAGWRAKDPAPRHPPHDGYARARGWRPPKGSPGAAGHSAIAVIDPGGATQC